MNLSGLLDDLRRTNAYQALLAHVRYGERQRTDLNLLNAARPYLLAALRKDATRHMLVVTPKPEHALQLYRQLSAWSDSPERVLYFAEPDSLPYERSSMAPDVR